MRPSVENDSGSLTKEMIVTNGYLYKMYIDVICEFIGFYCKNYVFRYVLWNDVFIDKLICVEIYDLVKRILSKVIVKRFS